MVCNKVDDLLLVGVSVAEAAAIAGLFFVKFSSWTSCVVGAVLPCQCTWSVDSLLLVSDDEPPVCLCS